MLRAVALLAAISLPAAAQEAKPITLSPQEYQQVLTELASRDPVVKLLLRKQDEAQSAAAKAGQAHSEGSGN